MAGKFTKSIMGRFSFWPQKGESRTYRLMRSWIATLVMLGILVALAAPLGAIGSGVEWGSSNDLFSLVFILFELFWMLGWSVAVAIMGIIFLATVFGRERVIFVPGRLIIRLELFGAGFSRYLDGDKIKSVARLEAPGDRSGVSWRGPHLTFDYEGELVSLGTDIGEGEAQSLTELIERLVQSAPPPDDSPTVYEPLADEVPEVVKTVDPAPGELGSLSSVALILANCVPVAGVLFYGWAVGEIMLLYWAESAVIGIYNLGKMWVIGRWTTLFMGPFFLGHYGGFMVMHLLFIYVFMIEAQSTGGGIPLADVLADFLTLAPCLIAFLGSHGISFVQNFLGKREYVGREVSEQMSEPYKRIIIMQLTLIFGGFLVMLFDSPLPALILMIVLKVAADLKSHLGEHKTS